MENSKMTPKPLLDSETFRNDNRQYYLDIRRAKNEKPYLQITRIDRQTDQTSSRRNIIFFEDDIFFLVEALSMLLGRYSSGHLGQNT